MSHIVIDGYNLIKQNPGLAAKENLSLEHGRQALISLLARYRSLKKHKITVVFDGVSQMGEFATTYKEQGIAICFSPTQLTADDVIQDIIQKEKATLIVVSSDHAILDFARKNNAAVIESPAFAQKLVQASLEKVGEVPPDDEEKSPLHKRWTTYKKGPKKRLPKKARQNRNRLKKL